jgi:hypothetical protein
MENKIKHTPGPWYSKDGDITAYKPSLIEGRGNRIVRIADYRSYEALQSKEVGYDEIKANARLIAAAPELLDALENVLDAFIHVPGDTEGNKARTTAARIIGSPNGLLARAREAIEKAKGG